MDNELNCSFFNNPNWENSVPIDHNDPFESALSSMVSSPTNGNAINNGESNNNNSNNIVLRELIGRLGSICSTPLSNNNNNSTNNSCYSTPLNSPPKLNLSIMENQQIRGTNLQSHFPPFSTDPGFAERAARFSSFANNNLVGLNEIAPNLDSANISRVSSNQSLRISSGSPPVAAMVHGNKDIEKKFRSSATVNAEFGDSRENSSVSDANVSSRKRKSVPKGKGKEANPAKDINVASENSDSNAKRSKSEDGKDAAKNTDEKQSKDNSKPPEAPKDYIHVRARRGQATDAHSLAERVRREKISERMKVLQDLVPGCNKVTGKAVMLDEIINYVQSLQRQVEFLSMKLATVNPRMDFNVEAFVSKDVFQSRGSLPPNMYASDGYPFQSQPSLQTEAPFLANTFGAAAMGRNQLPCMDNFSETAPQVSTFWEDDLHSVVQMGFGQNQTQNFHGIVPTSQMKIEL